MFFRRAGVDIMIQIMVDGTFAPPSRPLHALIFDLDGTLVDSLDDICNALNSGLCSMQRSPAPRDSVREWVGDGLPTLCRRAWTDASIDELSRLTKTAQAAYRAACVVHTRPYDNILKLLDLLKADGYALAVLSNKPHELACRVIDELDLRRFFQDVRGYVSEGDKKPSPQVALNMARRLGVPPHQVGLVGDSIVDIRTARNGDMKSIAVAWGYQPASKLALEMPDWLVSNPMEIFDVAAGRRTQMGDSGGAAR